MKKLLSLLITTIIITCSFNVAAQTDSGYTHLSVGVAGNSKLYLEYGETDTEYLKFVDYFGYGVTNNTSAITNETSYTARALRYTRDKSKASTKTLYLKDDNKWTVRGVDYVLEPDEKVIKLFRNNPVTIDDKELANKIAQSNTVTVDVKDGYYSEVKILACQDQYMNVDVSVEVFYEDKTSDTNKINIDIKPYEETLTEYGYYIAATADENTAPTGRRFHGYTVKTDETKAVTSIKYTVASTWRPVYIISQMAKNAEISEIIADINKNIEEILHGELNFVNVLKYNKTKKKIDVVKQQYGINEFENYDSFLQLSEEIENRLAEKTAFDIYVAIDGTKTASGSKEQPLDSIETARDIIEEAQRYKISGCPVNVIIREGEYYLNESIVFESKHSGTETTPITYKAYDGEEVIFTSGSKIDTSKFENVKDEAILNKLPSSAKKDVKQISLSNVADIDYFKPNADQVAVEDVLLISNGRQQPVAQYPNGDMNMAMGLNVIDKGSVRTDTLTNSGGGSIEITPQQAQRWKDISSMESYVMGAFHEPWQFERILIDDINPENNSLNLYSGSYMGLNNSNWGGLRYKLMHALCELDVPGEWYIDRETDILYYYPDEDVLNSEMYIAVNKDDLFKFENLSNVTFDGITFANSRGTAISSTGKSENITIKNCTFENLGKYGIYFDGMYDGDVIGSRVDSSYNLLIDSNNFVLIGNCAYYNNGSGHSGTLTPSNNVFSNNYVYDCSNTSRGYMLRLSNCVGDKVINNLIHKSELGGFTFTGNDMFVAYNEIYNIGQNAADCSAIYTGRTYVRTNNEIAYNYVHDSAPLFSQLINHHRGIYLDDGASGQYVHNNIASNVTYMTSANGKYNKITNNVIVGESKSPLYLFVSEYLTNSQMTEPLDKVRNSEKYSKIWLDKYKWLKDVEGIEDFNNNISSNVSQLPIYKDKEWENYNDEAETLSNNIVLGYGNFTPFVDPENHDFRIKAESEILAALPDIPSENNFSMDLIQVNSEKKANVQLQFTHSPFNAILPKNNSTVSQTENLLFMWQTAKYADEYELKIYRADDLTTPVYEKTTGTNYIEISSLELENAEYVWTVQAKMTSRQVNGNWYSNEKYNRFKVSAVAVNQDIYEYVDLRNYNNVVAMLEIGDTTQKRAEFRSGWAPNVLKVRNAVDSNNMAKVGDVYYMLNQLYDKYKGLYNYNKLGNDYIIDVADNKYEKLYVLAEMDVQDVSPKSIIVKYSDGSEEKLSLGEQVNYDVSGVRGSILPQIYTGAVWVANGTSYGQSAGMPRGDWFRAGIYSHPITLNKEKVLTEIIIPCNRNSNGEPDVYGFTTYAMTLKVSDVESHDTAKIKNLTNDDLSIDVLSIENHKVVESDKVSIQKGDSVVFDINLKGQKTFFWNLKTLTPYANTLSR